MRKNYDHILSIMSDYKVVFSNRAFRNPKTLFGIRNPGIERPRNPGCRGLKIIQKINFVNVNDGFDALIFMRQYYKNL